MLLTGFTLFSVLLLFPLLIIFFVFIKVFDAILSKIVEVLSINPSSNVFVFGDFSGRHKDCLINSGGADRLVKWPYSDG